MLTSIEIDADLLREAQALTGARTRSDTADLALRELVARHRRIAVLDSPPAQP
jgi:Arc/MetJ family transcription regulator